MSRLPPITFVALLVAGCALRAPVTPAPAPAPAAPPPAAAMLAAEFALARGDVAAARAAYLAAAAAEDDPELLARAVDVVAATGPAADVLPLVERWLAREPGDAVALRWRATLALRARDLAGAAADFERLYAQGEALTVVGVLAAERPAARALAIAAPLADAHPDDVALAYGVAALAERADQLALAARLVARALARRPAWDEAAVLEARIAWRREGRRAALAPLEKRAAATPRSALLAVQAASLLSAAGAGAEARVALDRYLALVPGDLDVRYARALLLAQGLDREAAAREFVALRDLGIGVDESPYWLGLMAELRGDELGALEWYRRVGDAGPLVGATLRAAGIVKRREGLALGRELIAEMRAARPDLAVEFAAGEAEFLFEAGERAAARALLDRALEAAPDDEGLRHRRAEYAAKGGDLAAAERDLRALLALRPDDPELQNSLGYTLADAGAKLDEARQLIDAALAAAPDSAAVVDSAGWVRFRQRDYAEARVLLERAWTLERDAEIGAHLGEVLWTLGERDAARQVWAAARERDADHAVLRATVERLER